MSQLTAKFKILWRLVSKRKLTEELKFHPTRKWRFDFCDEIAKVAIEIEGGIFVAGRHTRASGFMNDCDKYNEATMLGWSIIRLTPRHINVGYLQQISGWLDAKSSL